MSKKFIAYSESADTQARSYVEGKLSMTVEQFTSHFNNGIIANNSPIVKEILNKLIEAYKDVHLVGNNIVFVSLEEILIAETLEQLETLPAIATLVRVLTTLNEEGLVSESDIVGFPKGVASTLTKNADGEFVFAKLDAPRLPLAEKDLRVVRDKISSITNDVNEASVFKVSDALEYDLSLVHEVHALAFA